MIGLWSVYGMLSQAYGLRLVREGLGAYADFIGPWVVGTAGQEETRENYTHGLLW